MFEIHWQTTRVPNLRPLAKIRARETNGGAKNVNSVLAYLIKLQFTLHYSKVCYSALVRHRQYNFGAEARYGP
jgi:hypothetical protein